VYITSGEPIPDQHCPVLLPTKANLHPYAYRLPALVYEALTRWLTEDIHKGTRWVTALSRLWAMQGGGFSLQAIANQLNAEGIPMFDGKGQWPKGTVGNLLAQGDEIR
jgi:hypothetical protein